MSNNTDKKRMLQIGAVAKSFGVSGNTIRRIEAAGLLTPAQITDGSGYRYYDSENLLLLTELFSLKSFGFEYEDLREYLQRPGDYSFLYDKLLEKQFSINFLVDLFGRRLNSDGFPKRSIVELVETYCICKEVVMMPNRVSVSEFMKEFLYEAISQGIPINTAKTIQIITDCQDYRCFEKYQYDREQHLVFTIPLSKKVDHKMVRLFPGFTAISTSWNPIQISFQKVMPLIDEQFKTSGLVQSGALRVICNTGCFLSSDISPGSTVFRILIPFSNASQTDL